MSITSNEIIALLEHERNDEQRTVLMRFFRTAPGQYGEGDEFLGLRVPQVRAIVKAVKGHVELDELGGLLYSQWHEVRLAGFLLLVEEMKNLCSKRSRAIKGSPEKRRRLLEFYLKHARQANNWDLVDLSCPYIVGNFLILRPEETNNILLPLSDSENLWEQRIAIVSTITLIRNGIFEPTLRIIERLINHRHDLIHKAMGWMLREIGKKDLYTLRSFLEHNFMRLPRTSLRYAIERMSEEERLNWLKRRE